MKLLFVLLVIPMVLAGDFAKMWSEMEEKLKSKGWGEEDKKDLGNKFGQGDDQDKKWGDKEVKGWGDQDDEKKGWGEQDDEKKGWGDQDDEKKGWGEKDDEKKGWGGDKHKRRGGKRHRGGEDDDEKKHRRSEDDNDKDSSEDDKPTPYEQFKSWLQGQEKRDSSHEEFKDYMRRNFYKFKEYLKEKELKEEEDKAAKLAIYKQMEKVQLKKMLTEKLSEVTHKFMDQKLNFVYSITGHLLDFCSCDSSKDALQRVHDGTFGSPNITLDDNQYRSADDSFINEDFSNLLVNSSMVAFMKDPTKKLERIRWFNDLDHQDQFKFVLHEYITVMCSSAKYLTSMLKEAEPELIKYRRAHRMM
ncbi:uncharacterized protein LOC131942937 [Physella acuta]|uniref:uncharacterized protein LOC131942937 n=1 Tax=Physella acuta TaxID=109671 RepID=UPI0027DE1B37|nr:uncharacterized protein LOC131942937 [Physella acuta]